MVEVGSGTVPVDGGGPSGGILSNPRVLLIGGGAVAVAIVVLMMRRSGPAPAAVDDVAGPNVGVAIGSLESRLKESSGRLEEMLARSSGDLAGQYGSLADMLGDIGSDQNRFSEEQTRQAMQIRAQLRSLMDPSNQNRYQADYYQWIKDSGLSLTDAEQDFLKTFGG